VALLSSGLAKIFDKSLQGIQGGMATITELREAERYICQYLQWNVIKYIFVAESQRVNV
jgi:hypothetical protein